ncbi:hypothetical protein ACRN9O_13935 [Shewanella oncorhynchi]|uniref:hypothetical protein n=1 Tax=Shewanella oncorhynchi TaxID=2726434 RepID=UPI003D7A4280
MIHYHGGPITPDTCAIKAWKGRHAFISYANSGQLGLASEICQSFALDNGAFTFWKTGGDIDWNGYYEFVKKWMCHPRFDFAIIPDVIDGGEQGNDKLLEEWPLGTIGVPVWHMNESDERFIRLCKTYGRVAIGSCGEYDVKHPKRCVAKLKDVIRHVVTNEGYPIAKLHMLRGLNKAVFQHLPFSSADSTNVARNIGLDCAWKGTYQPQSKETRASILVERIEAYVSASKLTYDQKYDKVDIQLALEI